jgi:type III secretion system HrpE/YscL family protein
MGVGGVLDREVLEAGAGARELIQEAKEDARRIRQEARDILEKVQQEMEQAKRQGYDQGYQEGIQQAVEMLVRVKELRQKLFTDNEAEMLRLVFEIAKKIIGREFSKDDKAIMNVIRLAMSDAVGEKITVRLNPKDYEKIKKNEAEFLKSLENVKSLSFREDEAVAKGGCLVQTEIGTIDAQLDTQLSAIKKALGL